jgi:multisubunit Na+/H+ antiporter MnhB subunit
VSAGQTGPGMSTAVLSTIPTSRLLAALVLAGALGGTLAYAVLTRTVPAPDLATLATEALPASGVAHPITAVLLQYRSFDTLLEIAVLLAAALVAIARRGDVRRDRAHQDDALHPTEDASATANPPATAALAIRTPLLAALTLALHPILVLLAVYLLWAGSTRPGGAFQAGAVLAALGVLRRVSGVMPGDAWLARWRQPALLAGLATFLALATLMLPMGRALLAWPEGWAGGLILAIEAVLTVSIAVSLVGLFASAPDA